MCDPEWEEDGLATGSAFSADGLGTGITGSGAFSADGLATSITGSGDFSGLARKPSTLLRNLPVNVHQLLEHITASPKQTVSRGVMPHFSQLREGSFKPFNLPIRRSWQILKEQTFLPAP